MKPSLQVRLSQHLALTPQLQQSIRLLQLSTLELHQEIEQMLEQNPFLDAEEDRSPLEIGMERVAPPDDAGRERERERQLVVCEQIIEDQLSKFGFVTE